MLLDAFSELEVCYNAFTAGAPVRTPLGSLHSQAAFKGGEGRGIGKRREGIGEREKRRGNGRKGLCSYINLL